MSFFLKIAGVLVLVCVLIGCTAHPDLTYPTIHYPFVSKEEIGKPYIEGLKSRSQIRAERLAQILAVWTQEPRPEPGEYVLGPGDVIEVHYFFFGAADVSDRVITLTRTIPEDGVITLPWAGDVQVKGMTARQLEAQIRAAGAQYVKNPQAAVNIKEYHSSGVYIVGAIQKPGVYYLRSGRNTVLDLLGMAGGMQWGGGSSIGAGTVSGELPDVLYVYRKGGGKVVPPTAPPGKEGKSDGNESEKETPKPSEKKIHDSGSEPVRTVSGTGGSQGERASEPPKTEEQKSPSLQQLVNEYLKQGHGGSAANKGSGKSFAQASSGQGQTSTESAKEKTHQRLPRVTPQEYRQSLLMAEVAAQKQIARAGGGAKEPWAVVPDLRGRTIIVVDLIQLVDEGNLLFNIPLQNDDIVVIPPVVNKYVYVLGYVNAPGQYVFTERMRLDCVGAVAMAGGLKNTARPENTYLIRLTDEGIIRVPIDLVKMRDGIRPPIYLQPGDTLIVGTNWLVRVMEAIAPTYSQAWDKNLKFVGGGTGFQTLP